VVINSFNYDAYLHEAIESALAQTVSPREVIVVDDGSTDDSRDIIEGFGDLITPIFQPNSGQAAAINAGYHASSGSILIFADSDDVLLPTACQTAAELINNGAVAKA